MINLEDLLLSRIREILGIIAEGGVSHKEVSSVARHVQADYHGRFLVELLQNANDQVVKARQMDGTVEIQRTSDALAVGNVGLPFDDAGIRALTALGLSEKDPNLLIGNKGIGFKAVFEVAESPEIYSAPPGGGTIIDDEATAFTISQSPFAGDDGAARLRALVEMAVEEKPTESKKVGPNAVEVLIAAVHEAAPFKFPIGISSESTRQRLAEFEFDPADISTLMVLPLRTGEKTESSVNRALDEILESGGSFILFLPGVAKVRVTDSVRDLKFSVERQTQGPSETLEDGFVYSARKITTEEKGTNPTHKIWHVVEAKVGGDADQEAALALRNAAQDLPGDGQSQVTQAPVAVALPEHVAGEKSIALGTDGKFCIGLPTKVGTGTPAWIHSHFFGKISRQDLDLDYRFNEILFDKAVRLHRALVGRLKTDPSIDRRRLATLAFEEGEGPLADRLFSDDGDAFGPVILGEDGESFVCPTLVLVPKPEWANVVGVILGSCPEGAFEMPRMPDKSLLEGAQDLVLNLTKSAGLIERDVLLTADEGGRTPLEYAAEKNRTSGEKFWREFLNYAIELTGAYHTDHLGPLEILPVGTVRLAASSDEVFIQPAISVEISDDEGDEEPEAPEIERTTLESLPKDVFERLNFIDETQIRVRRENGRTLTGLASRLAPDKGTGLVSRPRKVEMILGSIVPAIDELATERPDDFEYGLQLLKIAGQWMEDVGEEDAMKVYRKIRVPVLTDQNQLEWAPAGFTYFGRGWACENEELLLTAYSGLPGRLLLPYERLNLSSSKEDVELWRGVMSNIGVNTKPRLILPTRRFGAQFRAEGSYTLGVADEVRCPIEEATPFWGFYLADCSGRTTSVGSRQLYRFSEISWIEGLEREESRRPIVEMVLKEHEHYSPHSKVQIGRKENPETMDSSGHVSLWSFAIRHGNWPCIPGDDGICRPSECWLIGLRSDSGQQGRFECLRRVRRDVLPARALLKRFGVADIQDPDPKSLLEELERCARRLDSEATDQPLLRNLVDDLFERLQRNIDRAGSVSDLDFSARPLPLLKRGKLVAINSDEIGSAYIDDAPDKTAFLPELDDALIWPLPVKNQRGAEDFTVATLRRSFGETAAILVSEMEVQTGFEALFPPLPLRDWLRESGCLDPGSVMVDLACLLCMSPTEFVPGSDEFNKVWEQFEVLKIVRGEFPEGARVDHFLQTDGSGQLLQVSANLDHFSVTQELWRLGGDRNLFEAYIGNARSGATDHFFRARGFLGKEREDVEFAVEVLSGEQLEGIKAAVFALRRKAHGESLEEFLSRWNAKRDSWEEIVNWIGRPFTTKVLEQALAAGSAEARSLEVLRIAGVTVPEWQDARRVLGMAPHRFDRSDRLWTALCKQVTAVLKASVARRSSADFGYAKSVIEALNRSSAPELILYASPDANRTLAAVIDIAEGLLSGDDSKGRSVLERTLQAMRDAPKITSASDLRVAEIAPARDVAEYRDNDESERTRRAIEWCMQYLRIAGRLAGAEEDFGELLSQPSLVPLTTGYWANRFSMVPALQGVLESRAPAALQEMKDRGAFRSASDIRQLGELFPELDSKDREATTEEVTLPPKKVEVLGVEIEEDLIIDELVGHGSLADALASALDQETFDPVATLDRDRVGSPAVLPKRSNRRRRSPSDVRHSNEQKNLVGQIGELYVYRWLQKLGLPSFDQECWISSNRCPFLACEDGDDSAGFDFRVKDEGNRLTQRSDEPSVLIEVKATGSADDGQFLLTASEWQRAIRASRNGSEEYWIVVVEDALSSPRISQIVKDPYRLMTEAKLRFDHDTLSVKVGTPMSGTSDSDSPDE